MYEELVKRLRSECALLYSAIKDMRDAADAIDELKKVLNTVHDAHNEGYDVGYWAGRRDYEPKWIPVTERLPEESEGLRWREDLMIRFTSVWCCDINTGIIEVRNRLQGIKTGIACLDQYTKDTNWHWSNALWEPTHWMPIVPLPETPKEET